MSSEVEICNLALAQLGDSATVASIDPPEGSSQAEHCARWYPIARDSLLEMFDWPFATKRSTLAQLATPASEWGYAYAKPSDALKILEVRAWSGNYVGQPYWDGTTQIWYAPDALAWLNGQMGTFTTEADENGDIVIYSHTQDAMVRYTSLVTDTSKFSPLFRDTLATYLASYLAGPVLKGETGINVGRAKKQEALAMLNQAKLSAASQQRQRQGHTVPWLGAR